MVNKMRSMLRCDGSQTSWWPEWVDHECGECGQVTGRHDAAEPNFHGLSKWNTKTGNLECSRCGEILPDIEKINKIVVEKLLPKLEEDLASSRSPMLAWLKRGGRWR